MIIIFYSTFTEMPESTENKVVPISGLVHEWCKTVAAQLANFSATKEKKEKLMKRRCGSTKGKLLLPVTVEHKALNAQWKRVVLFFCCFSENGVNGASLASRGPCGLHGARGLVGDPWL